ncbi:hypothetical protein [Vitiosangium sp. GDMCC 1.1324]|uniref:hypothetical protein n=1 Tax=Vitiosangium sp. (strain GDMCC 1.1324) TaxID=2138576 RepID=UPI000D4200AA|nr:hypothetical protein [Vitiosangium sp. GDMCC 1.1324]PTL75868.1 hypothetical protein DAT35_52220 [Vitiosangium sp. GDMCC 1.1324]
MQRSLSAGTDAAGLCIFDPAAMPGDFDGRLREDPPAALDELAAAGRLYRWETGADGSYTLGLWVDKAMPSDLRPHAQPLAQLPAFQIPGGRLYFAGIEYVFRDDDAFLKKHPHMGQSSDVPAGTYGFELYELAYPEGYHEDLLNHRLTHAERRAHAAINVLLPVGGVLLAVATVLMFVLSLRSWATMVLPFAAIVLLVMLASTRLPAYRRARQVKRSMALEQPDYALVLRRQDESSRGARAQP